MIVPVAPSVSAPGGSPPQVPARVPHVGDAGRVAAAALALARQATLPDALRTTCEQAVMLTGSSWASIVAWPNPARPDERVGARSGRGRDRNDHALSLGLTTGDGRRLGIIRLGDRRSVEPFSGPDLELLGGMLPLASVAIERTAAHDALMESWSKQGTDRLTGLPTARIFTQRAAEEAERASRHRRQLALAIFDVDHLSQVNASRGHRLGDRVLIEVARRMVRLSRSGDVVARMGGGMFAWLMPEASSDDAGRLAETVCESLAAESLLDPGTVTLSGGVAHHVVGEEATELYLAADAALGWAKQQGRGRCVRYEAHRMPILRRGEDDGGVGGERAITSLRTVASLVDAKDPLTRDRAEQVSEVGSRIAARLGWSETSTERLRDAAMLHGIGLVSVPGAILRKTGSLTGAERARIRRHPSLGSEIAAGVLDAEQTAWIRWQHERPDGDGPPDGLGPGDTPAGAHVIGVASAWCAMTSPRRYRPAMPEETAIGILAEGAGSAFAPEPVDALVALWQAGALPSRA